MTITLSTPFWEGKTLIEYLYGKWSYYRNTNFTLAKGLY